MDLELSWLLIGGTLAFVLGWLLSRFDLKQWRGDRRSSPRDVFHGLNLLLNEQQDKAIDAFIAAVQHEPRSIELHFALGNLFRRRGEHPRAIRVHEHLLARGDLSNTEHERAQAALAQDFMAAGLMDRAEAAWQALEGGQFDTDARLARLSLQERSHDWHAAMLTAQALEHRGAGSFATRVAHHHGELAQLAQAQGRHDEASLQWQRAQSVAPHAARPWVQGGEWAFEQARLAQACEAWEQLARVQPAFMPLVAQSYAQAAAQLGAQGDEAQQARALRLLQQLQAQRPSLELAQAVLLLQPAEPGLALKGLTAAVKARPSLGGAHRLLQLLQADGRPQLAPEGTAAAVSCGDWNEEALAVAAAAVEQAARPQERYRCAACGFEAQRYFWQCPGCLSWDSFPPERLDASVA